MTESQLRLFILYTADLEEHITEHAINYHAFADNTQLYVHCRQNDTASAVLRLENCFDEVSHWMSANADKTEVLWVGSRYGSALLGSAGPSLRFRNKVIAATDHVCVLGVTLSSDLSTSRTLARRASTGCASFDGSDVCSTPTPLRRSSTPL